MGGLIQKIMPLYLKIGWFFQIGRVWQQVKVIIYKFSVTQMGFGLGLAWLGCDNFQTDIIGIQNENILLEITTVTENLSCS